MKTRDSFKVLKFAGLTLGGGKGRKTSLSIIEYFVKENKVFLSELHENIAEKARVTADSQIVHILEKQQKALKYVAIDAPLKLPKCIRCRLTCPGHEKCDEPEIKWMWKWHKSRDPKKRPNKIFTPYTERCVEQWIATEFENLISMDHALGSNRAPLSARAMYLKRRLENSKVIEAQPKVSAIRLSDQLGLKRSHMTQYKHLTKGPGIRKRFLDKWSGQGMSFIYHRDFKVMSRDAFAFESFLNAYTAYLFYKDLCEPRPKGFPKSEAWVAIPR